MDLLPASWEHASEILMKACDLAGINFSKCMTCSVFKAIGTFEGSANYLLKEEINF